MVCSAMNFPARLNTFLQQKLRENVLMLYHYEEEEASVICCVTINHAFWTGKAATRSEAKRLAARSALYAIMQLNLESRIRHHLLLPERVRCTCVNDIRDNLKVLKKLVRKQPPGQQSTLLRNLSQIYPIIDGIEELMVVKNA